jgi:agmatine deiminase
MTTIPAEWRPHRAIWTAWPSAADLWGEDLEPARAEVAAMIRALADGGRGDAMRVLAHGREAEATAKLALGQSAEVISGAFGDIWFRDIGPIFTADGRALGFKFNGWGGKYQLPHDDEVSARVALLAKAEFKLNDFILEGGAIEMDGEGTLLSTCNLTGRSRTSRCYSPRHSGGVHSGRRCPRENRSRYCSRWRSWCKGSWFPSGTRRAS